MLVEELRGLREEQAKRRRLLGTKCEDYDLVFCQSDGKPLHAHNIVQRDFRRVLALDGLRKELGEKGVPEDALPKGLPRIRFHDLRHAHATLLLQQGVHPKVVQERLGHSTISMTLDIYSHVVPGMQEQAVHRFQARLFGGMPWPTNDSKIAAPPDQASDSGEGVEKEHQGGQRHAVH